MMYTGRSLTLAEGKLKLVEYEPSTIYIIANIVHCTSMLEN